MKVTLEQLRDWLATQRYDVDEHMGEPAAIGWTCAVNHLIAELPRYWERIARGEYSLGHCAEQRSSLGDSQNHAPGNVGPNQAGADGNGAAGQTFSQASSASPHRSNAGGAGTSLVNRGLRELRDAPAVAAPGVLLDWFDEGAER